MLPQSLSLQNSIGLFSKIYCLNDIKINEKKNRSNKNCACIIIFGSLLRQNHSNETLFWEFFPWPLFVYCKKKKKKFEENII